MESPKTPDECKLAILAKRFTNPMVNKTLMAQELFRWSNEDIYAMLAYHAIEALETTQKAYMDLLSVRDSTNSR